MIKIVCFLRSINVKTYRSIPYSIYVRATIRIESVYNAGFGTSNFLHEQMKVYSGGGFNSIQMAAVVKVTSQIFSKDRFWPAAKL